MINRHALLVLIGLCVLLWAFARACAPHRAESQPGTPSATWAPAWPAPKGRAWLPLAATGKAQGDFFYLRHGSVKFRPQHFTSSAAGDIRGDKTGARLPLSADVRGPGRVCSGAWAGAGTVYTARHCLPSNPLLLRVDGALVTAWQADASGRDLAQVVTGVGGAAPALAILTAGDALTLRPARGDVPAVYAGDGWGDSNGAGYMVLTDPYPGARPLGIACADPSARVLIGDSGGGAYRTDGGSLGGIVVAAEAEPGDADVWCGAGQSVVIERVP